MASKTRKMLQLEEEVKKRIVDGHRRGVCDREGRTIHRPAGGFGHLNWCPCNFGPTRLNMWPRDANGNLIGDN